MEIVKLGKKGQVSIPKAILRDLALQDDTMLLVEPTPEGGILLRPAAVYPIERYSEKRIQEFLREDHLSPKEAKTCKSKAQVTLLMLLFLDANVLFAASQSPSGRSASLIMVC